MECCRQFPEGQVRFARYFKRSWYNRLKRLYRDAYALKRQGQEVEIEQAEILTQKLPSDLDFIERMESRYLDIKPFLSLDARRLLETLLDPPPQVMELAYVEFCRKYKLSSQGQHVRGLKKFRIKTRHIRKSLGFSSSRMREVVAEVKSVVRKHKSHWRKVGWQRKRRTRKSTTK